jgi:hypothetical protein
MVVRAVARLARPRIQSWVEREARKIVARDVGSDAALRMLQQIMGQFLRLLELPRLNGGDESFIERVLQLLAVLFRLTAQANRGA